MHSKLGRERPRVSQRLPHPSWNLDKPVLVATPDSDSGEPPPAGRTVTPEEIWAVVDAAGPVTRA